MNGITTVSRQYSAIAAAFYADEKSLSAFVERTTAMRGRAEEVGRLNEWWDEFWKYFALTVARGGENNELHKART